MVKLVVWGEESSPLLRQSRNLSFPSCSSFQKEQKKEKEHYFADSCHHCWKAHFSVGIHRVIGNIYDASFKCLIEETDEARKKFSNAKAISSAQFFGDQSKAEMEAAVSLQKFSGSSAISSADLFGDDHRSDMDLTASDLINRISFQAQQDMSSLKNIAGETGKRLGSFASTLISDFQDRLL